MCSPEAIAITKFAIDATSAVSDYKDAKAVAKQQAINNEKSRASADKAYLADLENLDAEKRKEQRDTAIRKEAKQRELIKKEADAQLVGLEKGNANTEAVLRDIGFDYQPEFQLYNNQTMSTNMSALKGYNDAYSALQRSYNSLPAISTPSKLGLLIKVGGSGASTYGDYNAGKYGKVS
jgi:hypothetical protein